MDSPFSVAPEDEALRLRLAKAVARLIEQVPRSVLRAYAENVLKAQPEECAEVSRSFITAKTPSAHNRAQLQSFERIWLNGARRQSCEAVGFAILAALEVAGPIERRSSLELVWTGPDADGSSFRRTEQAVHEVVDSARDSLTIVSYSIFQIPHLRDRIERRMDDGVEVSIIVEGLVEKLRGGIDNQLTALGERIRRGCSLYCWPQENRPKDGRDRIGTLHAKCLVADVQSLFISSANLTENAFSVNMELGVLIQGGEWPQAVQHHFNELIRSGILVSLAT